MKDYQNINSQVIDSWVETGWEWGTPIDHETFVDAKNGKWSVVLTPTKPVPKEWFGELSGKKVLGLASGGGQQIPVFSALGAQCTVLDYSKKQLESEQVVAQREDYTVETIRHDMTKTFPLRDNSFDLIFHPVSNCYVEDVIPIWRECFRVLKPGGALLAGFDIGVGYAFNEEETDLVQVLPFNPNKDSKLYEESIKNDWGIQFSHTIEEQLGGQLAAGLRLTDIFQDTNGSGRLHEFNVPTFYATRSVKPDIL